MPISFEDHIRPAADVLVSDLDGESVLLNLRTESYYGLDAVGARMWHAVTAADSVGQAFVTLAEEFDVNEQQLHRDLIDLLATLEAHGLIDVKR